MRLVGICAMVLCACGEPVVVEVVIEPGALDPVVVGEGVALTATATYDDDHTEDVTSAAEWTSGDDSIATVDDEGWVTGVAAGEGSAAAAFGGVTAEVTFEVEPPGPFDVTIHGDWGPQHGDQGLSFVARLIDEEDGAPVACGSVVADDAVWSLSAAGVLIAGHKYHAEAFADVNGDGIPNDAGHLYASKVTRKAQAALDIEVPHSGAAPAWADVGCGPEAPLSP